MRKLFLLLPLLLLPAFANAAHTSPLEKAANRLESSAHEFNWQVAHMRGNWRLKNQADRFAALSSRLARQASYNPRPRRLRITLNRLDRSFYDLQSAVQRASAGGKKKKLRRRLAKIDKALNRVERRVAYRTRLASARANGRYVGNYYAAPTRDRRARRYRD